MELRHDHGALLVPGTERVESVNGQIISWLASNMRIVSDMTDKHREIEGRPQNPNREYYSIYVLVFDGKKIMKHDPLIWLCIFQWSSA
jgi:hypothetical protein